MPITQPDFFINASTGNDAYSGATAATAICTHAELEKRINADVSSSYRRSMRPG